LVLGECVKLSLALLKQIFKTCPPKKRALFIFKIDLLNDLRNNPYPDTWVTARVLLRKLSRRASGQGAPRAFSKQNVSQAEKAWYPQGFFRSRVKGRRSAGSEEISVLREKALGASESDLPAGRQGASGQISLGFGIACFRTTSGLPK
jgi:hypothetical protein